MSWSAPSNHAIEASFDKLRMTFDKLRMTFGKLKVDFGIGS